MIDDIYLGDCLELIKNIDDKSIDLIVTDPPYLINYKTNMRKDKNHRFCKVIQNDDNPQLIADIIKECYRVLKDNTAMYMFCNSKNVDYFKKELEKYFNIKNIIIWVKNNHTMGDLKSAYGSQYEMIIYCNKGQRELNGKRETDVWSSHEDASFKRVVGLNQVHQNEKPLNLIKKCILKSSNEEDIVLDPFIGGGTTAVGAKETNRHYIGFEIDKYYYDIAKDRINGISANGQMSIFTDFTEV